MAGQPQEGRENNVVIKTHETFWRAETEDTKSQVSVNCLCKGYSIAQDLSSCRMGYVFAWEVEDEGR